MNPTDDKSLQTYARLAGFMYVILIPLFMAPNFIISSISPTGGFATTAHKVATSEHLYRIALSIQTAGAVAMVLLIGSLYIVTVRVDRNLALLALLWRIAETVLGGLAVAIRFAILENYVRASNDTTPSAWSSSHQLLMSSYHACFYVATMFFSLGSTTFFFLLLKARFIPRILALFGILASLTVAGFGIVTLAAPEQASAIELAGWAPIFIAEIATGLWLLIAGLNSKYWSQEANTAQG